MNLEIEISSKCFTIASTILVVRVTLGADERADNDNDRDDQTNQFLRLKLPHTLYFSLSNQQRRVGLLFGR